MAVVGEEIKRFDTDAIIQWYSDTETVPDPSVYQTPSYRQDDGKAHACIVGAAAAMANFYGDADRLGYGYYTFLRKQGYTVLYLEGIEDGFSLAVTPQADKYVEDYALGVQDGWYLHQKLIGES